MTAESEFRFFAGRRILVLSPTPTHPQDYGNRKRIFEVCKNLQDNGARITFLHYPSEAEWRSQLPAGAELAMRECWHRYFMIPPTRWPHTEPAGPQHAIDEWFDPAIGQFLQWMFRMEAFDAFIVNYAWLSKALEFAPHGIFKILDTHDKVSDRKEVLASLGLGPEFFYTTKAEEAVALGRADLVWAIKDQEKALFEEMAKMPVLTLPHLDPPRDFERPAPGADGILTVGIIGARNNINRINITEFLRTALPVFETMFAPIKLVIAGTICELLQATDSRFVELRGPIENVEDFYRSIDCAAVPMRASTGLKIKTGEALSLGVPIVSLTHAFEGYEPADTLHQLPDFEAMANALVDLSFAARDRLDVLAEASRTSYAVTAAAIERSFRETARRIRAAAPSIVLTVDSRAFVPGTILNRVLESLREYFRHLGHMTVLVVRGSASDLVDHAQVLDRFFRIVVAGDLPDAERCAGPLNKHAVDVVDVETWLRGTRPKMLIVDALHPALFTTTLPDTVVISRAELIAISQGAPVSDVPGRGFQRSLIAAPKASTDVASLAVRAGASIVLTPCFHRLGRVNRTARSAGGRKTVALLGAPDNSAVQMAGMMAEAWGLAPFVICGLGHDQRQASQSGAMRAVHAGAYLDAFDRSPLPDFAIDLSQGGAGLMLCRELLQRLHVPLVSCSGVGMHPSLRSGVPALKAGTERELWTVIRSFAAEADEAHAEAYRQIRNEFEGDSGWAWFWRTGKALFAVDHKS